MPSFSFSEKVRILYACCFKLSIANGHLCIDLKNRGKILLSRALLWVLIKTALSGAIIYILFKNSQLKGDDSRSMTVFFNWYYWSINIGTLIALGGIAYLQQSVKTSGFFKGYLVGICCLFTGLIVFLLGEYKYYHDL